MVECSSEGCNNEAASPRKICNPCRRALSSFGITQPDKERLLSEQGGRCLICDSSITFTGRPSAGKHDAVVDHCHDSGNIRGILCGSCNIGLGKFYDKPNLLRTAADYLEESDV